MQPHAGSAGASRGPLGGSPAQRSASPLAQLPDLDVLLEKHAVPARELLSYYRKRLAASERDAEDAQQRLVAVECHSAELHRLRWTLRSRDEEVKELQAALSSAKVLLYDEREMALRLAAENDELKAREAEDRRRIAHLLALTEPIAQEVRGGGGGGGGGSAPWGGGACALAAAASHASTRARAPAHTFFPISRTPCSSPTFATAAAAAAAAAAPRRRVAAASPARLQPPAHPALPPWAARALPPAAPASPPRQCPWPPRAAGA